MTDNTVLHLAAYHYPSLDLFTILLDAGAHIDAVNKSGDTFEKLTWRKRPYDAVYLVKYTTLACLAARVVRKTYDISFVPKNLQDFVLMH